MPRRTTDDLTYLWAITDWRGNLDRPESLSMDREDRMVEHGWIEDGETTEDGTAAAVKLHVRLTKHYRQQDATVGEKDYTVEEVREIFDEKGVTEVMASVL